MENQVEVQAQVIEVKPSMILADLANGLTRTAKDKFYDAAIGCIKDKYNLTGAQMKQLFAHPKLKGRKTAAAIEAAKTRSRVASNRPVLVIVEDESAE